MTQPTTPKNGVTHADNKKLSAKAIDDLNTGKGVKVKHMEEKLTALEKLDEILKIRIDLIDSSEKKPLNNSLKKHL